MTTVHGIWTARFAEPLPRSATLVATDAGEVVGFAGVGPPLDGEPEPGEGWLYTLYLLPDRWGRGLGRLLHDAAVARLGALGFTTASLWVLDGNEPRDRLLPPRGLGGRRRRPYRRRAGRCRVGGAADAALRQLLTAAESLSSEPFRCSSDTTGSVARNCSSLTLIQS